MDTLRSGGIKTKLKYFLLIFLLVMPASASFNPVRSNKEAWTCYDYSLNFSENNPDWGIVCISNNRYFKGFSHMVNYKLLDNGSLLIHDGLYKSDYDFTGWECVGHYHFFINEPPRRYYKWLFDNRETILSDYNERT